MKKQKAFLFDMDGVIVNSEGVWHTIGSAFAENLYGKEIVDQMGDTTGMSLDHEYAFAKTHGFEMELEEFYKQYDEIAKKVYQASSITEGFDILISTLKEMKFLVGVVSSSRRPWVNDVLSKLSKENYFDYILSLNEAGLPSKPDPKGYLQAMRDLGVGPTETFVLEDSNSGITSAKKSGAFTIAFTPLLVDGYKQIEADAKANSFDKVLEIVKSRI